MKKISLALSACALLGLAACSDRPEPVVTGDANLGHNTAVPPPPVVTPVAPGMGDVVDTNSGVGATDPSSGVTSNETTSSDEANTKVTKTKKHRKVTKKHHRGTHTGMNNSMNNGEYGMNNGYGSDGTAGVGATSPSAGVEGDSMGGSAPKVRSNPAAINSHW